MRRLREDGALEHLHRTSTRTRHWPALAVLAFDHRTQLEELAARLGAEPARVADFKQLVARASRDGYAAAARNAPAGAVLPLPGVIVDDRHGDDVLAAAHRHRLVGRPARSSSPARGRWRSSTARTSR